MKRLWIALALFALCAPAALAVGQGEAEDIARAAAGGAEVTRVERDDGVYEIDLRGEGARFHVDVLESTGAVLKVEAANSGAGRGARFALSEADARQAAAEVAPEAAQGFLARERGTDGSAYTLLYAAPGAVGEITVNAETGAIVRTERYPEAAERGVLSVDEVERRIADRIDGARIVELELDWDGSRYLYEGEAEANGRRYSFELDAQSGAIVELERDD